MIKRRIITIYESKGNFGDGKQVYQFGLNKNGCPESLEKDIINTIKDMNRIGIIDITKFHNMLDFETSKLSISNISKNIEIPVNNLENNLKLISKRVIS